MHSEADEEEKKSDVKSRNSHRGTLTGLSNSIGGGIGDANNTAEAFSSPVKFERILDSIKSEEKVDGTSGVHHEDSSAADAKRQTEAIIKAEEEE